MRRTESFVSGFLLTALLAAGCGDAGVPAAVGTGTGSASATAGATAATAGEAPATPLSTSRVAPESMRGTRPDFDRLRRASVTVVSTRAESGATGRAEELRPVLAGAQAALDACYAERTITSPTLRGSVEASVTFSAGKVTRHAATHSGENAGLERCFGTVLGDLSAPGFEGTFALAFRLYRGLALPSTMPRLPPPPPVGSAASPASARTTTKMAPP